MAAFRFGPQTVTALTESAGREWLVADGCGGYAMGTVAELRTRRYPGLLITSAGPPGQRQLGLAALDPVVETGGSTHPVNVHSPPISPSGRSALTQTPRSAPVRPP